MLWVALGDPLRNWSTAARWSTVAAGDISAVSKRRRRSEVFPVPWPPTTCPDLKIPSDVKHYKDRRTIKLKVGGRRARRWLYFVAEVLKAEGGYGVMYSDEMGAPSAGFPGERNGLWNGIGEWASIPKDVFVGPLWVGDTGGWSSRMLFMSTRSSGHGIP